MRTVGIDLASKPARTAACVIDWNGGSDSIQFGTGLDDDAVIDYMCDPDFEKVGIDAPFGWSTDYVKAVSDFNDQGVWPLWDGRSKGYKDRIPYRETERQLGAGLSPALGNLAWTVRRSARLIARWAEAEGAELDRTGEGHLVEVYPAAALRKWNLYPDHSYKKDTEEAGRTRQKLVKKLVAELKPTISLTDDSKKQCGKKGGDHLVDAFVAALVAKAMASCGCEKIPEGLDEAAKREGWIRMPKGNLKDDVVGACVD